MEFGFFARLRIVQRCVSQCPRVSHCQTCRQSLHFACIVVCLRCPTHKQKNILIPSCCCVVSLLLRREDRIAATSSAAHVAATAVSELIGAHKELTLSVQCAQPTQRLLRQPRVLHCWRRQSCLPGGVADDTQHNNWELICFL